MKNLLLSTITGNAPSSPFLDLNVDTLLLAGLSMTLILAVGSIVARGMVAEGAGGPGQFVVEGLYNFTDDLALQNIGHQYKKFFPLIASIFIFVLISNFLGVFPSKALEQGVQAMGMHWPHIMVNGEMEPWEWKSPTTDFNVTFGLALVALFTYIGSGFWKHKSHFFKIYLFSPMSWVEWLDTIIRPATLAIRLMVVITADELLRAAFLIICPILLPVGVMGFELFIGGIQALVFALLTSVYIGLTIQEHH